jgi:thioredoxin reductase
VVVIGAGASAMDIAAQLADSGVSVSIVAREKKIRWHTPPSARNILSWLTRPMSGIGPGWRSLLCTKLPRFFHAMPQALRFRATRNHLGPAPGWFTRAKVETRVPMLLGTELVGAAVRGHRVGLMVTKRGEEREILCDHVIAATGYKVDMNRLTFLEQRLLRDIKQVDDTPVLTGQFETSVHGLYVIGPAAANSFGPMMRFMFGAQYTSPLLARHLRRRLRRFTRSAPVSGRTFKPA